MPATTNLPMISLFAMESFMTAMVKKHEATIDMFEKAANDSKDSDVKTFINNTLPKVREHLDSAKAIRKELK